jgi:hypothetical protein
MKLFKCQNCGPSILRIAPRPDAIARSPWRAISIPTAATMRRSRPRKLGRRARRVVSEQRAHAASVAAESAGRSAEVRLGSGR